MNSMKSIQSTLSTSIDVVPEISYAVCKGMLGGRCVPGGYVEVVGGDAMLYAVMHTCNYTHRVAGLYVMKVGLHTHFVQSISACFSFVEPSMHKDRLLVMATGVAQCQHNVTFRVSPISLRKFAFLHLKTDEKSDGSLMPGAYKTLKVGRTL
jgi:hypothetical protein